MATAHSSEASKLYHEALKEDRENCPEVAVRKLIQAITLSPCFQDAFEALSVILYNQKKFDVAIDWCKKWIQVSPNDIMAHTNLSRCYVAKGLILEAEREQAEARRLTWKADLSAKKQQMPAVDYEERISRYKQVIELDPKDVLGYFSLGNAYLDAGKKREAVDTFEKAIAVDPNHSASYLGFGQALEALGDKDKAKRIYLRGIEVAKSKGDVLTQKKMESRVNLLSS